MGTGRVFDVKRYAIHDGPGIRTTVFLKGCPLRCWWCHNPEGQQSQFELIYRRARCIECHACADACPRKALTFEATSLSVDRGKCDLCGSCVRSCPSGAVSIVGKLVSVEEIMEEIERDRPFYEESGGGVTVSGGEPFFQPKFLNELLNECKMKGVSAAVSTCGFFSTGVLDGVRDWVDLFLFDLKLMDESEHRKFTGVSNKPILRNVKTLAGKGRRLVVTFPVIPGINDDDRNIREMGEFLSNYKAVENVTLLPYHRGGIEKYRSLWRSYRLQEIEPPAHSEMNRIRGTLEKYGLRVTEGGG